MSNAGQPKIFKNDKELLNLLDEYCDYIKENKFIELPTQTNFVKWLDEKYDKKLTRRTIYNTKEKYFPTIKKEFEQILADTLSEGSALGKYRDAITIFCLKNWFGWKDKIDLQADVNNTVEYVIKPAQKTNE